jgi:hypothetical protein
MGGEGGVRVGAGGAEEGRDLVAVCTRCTRGEEGEYGVEGRGREGDVLVGAMEAKVAEESHGEGGLVPDGIGEQLLLGHCQCLLTSSLGGRLYIGLPEQLKKIFCFRKLIASFNYARISMNLFPAITREDKYKYI